MVDKPHSVRDRDFYPSSRSQIFPLYGCQSLWMGSSFRADNTILSWSLNRRPIPAPYQYGRNDGHMISTETSQNIYSPFLHHDIHRQHNGGLIHVYQQTGWHSFPQSLRRSLENSQLVPGTRHSYQSSSHSRQIQHSWWPPLKTRQTYQDRMGSGSNSCEFSIPDAQFPKCGSVRDTIQAQTPIICLSSTRLQSTSDRCPVHGLESSSCICFSSFYSDTCCSRENPTTSVQNSSHSSVLATTTVILRTSSSISVSPIRLPLIPRLLTQSKGRFVHQNLPILDLHAWELSNNQSEIRNIFAKRCRFCLQIKKNIYTKSLQCKMDHLL